MLRVVVVGLFVLSSTAFAQSYPERSAGYVRTVKTARVSLTPDGPWLNISIGADTDLIVYDDSTPRPRFGDHMGEARLLFYVDRDALAKAITTASLVTPTESATPGKDLYSSVGFVASPGTTVELLAPENAQTGRVKVRIVADNTEITGFVVPGAVGNTFRYDLTTKRPAWKPGAALPKTFALLDKPKGTAFAQVTATTSQEAMVLQRKAGFALVRISNGAVGWIATKQLGKLPARASGDDVEGEEGGVAGGVVGGSYGAQTLEENTPLFDRIDGGFVGVAAHFDAKPVETRGPWKRYSLSTFYGTVSVWSSSQKGPEPPPQNVPPTLLEGSRIAGDKNIAPDDATKTEIRNSGKDKAIGTWKLCIDRAGAITVIKKLKGTGFYRYDQIIEAGMGEWKYKPFEVNGAPVPVCTAITFIYSQK